MCPVQIEYTGVLEREECALTQRKQEKYVPPPLAAAGVILAGVLVYLLVEFVYALVFYRVWSVGTGYVEGLTETTALTGLQEEELALLEANPRLQPVLQAPGDYPQSLTRLALQNPETEDLLLGYPQRLPQTSVQLTPAECDGRFPAFMQWDPRWAYLPYGEDFMAVTGCGPVSLSAAAVYLTGDAALHPAYVAERAASYYYTGTGTGWELYTKGVESLGLVGQELPLDKKLVYEHLQQGEVVLASVGAGAFTQSAGHVILLLSMDEDGQITVHDPAHSRNNSQSFLWDDVSWQFKNLWALRRA